MGASGPLSAAAASAAASSGAASVQAVVAAGGADAAAVMDQVEERMLALAAGHGPALERFAASTLSAGGKRLRPLLVCLASGVPVRPNELLVRAASAVELVHAATLVHDDVIDASDLRRGRTTVAAAGGRLMALAVGDFLFSRAFAELAGSGSPEAVRVLAAASADLAAGELMQREDAWNVEVTVERYLERCRLKTGVLFKAACELGALAGGGDQALLGRFGERIGIAFQLLDDVLDVTGPPERTGKPRAADLLDGTVTLPLIEAAKRDQALASIDLSEVRTPAAAAEIADRIEASGALELARQHALTVVAEAKAGLVELPQAQRTALGLVADGVVERYS
jgi:geranylgeranyl pyrophosphate synthase